MSGLCLRVEADYDKNSPTWRALARIAMLCNRAEFKQGEETKPVLRRSVCLSVCLVTLVYSVTRHCGCTVQAIGAVGPIFILVDDVKGA